MSALPELARTLFQPRAVAIAGASDNPDHPGARPLAFLRRHGFAGTVYPLNRSRETVMGEPAWRRLQDLPERPDLAFVLVGHTQVESMLVDCAEIGVPATVILADGFAEAGPEGESRQRQIRRIARASGMRLVGPNSLGLCNTHTGLALTGNAAFRTERLIPGRLAVLSQSGTILGTLLSRGQARGIGFSKMVSVGNEADLTIGEIGLSLVDDPETDAFLLFLEVIREPGMLARFAEAAYRAGKPVIAYKLGASDTGRRLAVSHTGAIVGSDAAADAFLRRWGIIRVHVLEALFETAPFAIAAIGDRCGTARVAVLTTTGGGGAMVADGLAKAGVEVVGADETRIQRLTERGVPVHHGPLVDVTLAGARREIMEAAVSEMRRQPGLAGLVAAIGSSAQFEPERAVDPLIAGAAERGIPIAVHTVPEAPESLRRLACAGVAAFRTPEACADGVAATVKAAVPPSVTRRTLGLERLVARLHGLAIAEPTFDDALAVFRELGVETVPGVTMSGHGPVPSLPFPFPVALKALGVEHKTEAGANRLGIHDVRTLLTARDQMIHALARLRPPIQPSGFVVQPMIQGLAEVLVGYCHDAEAGPIISVGVGGVLAEIYQDVSVRPAPVDEAEAMIMLGEVRGLAPVRGYRNLPAGDVAGLARTVAAISRLALVEAPRVLEAEANPVMVLADRTVAVDGLLRLAPPW